MSDDFDLRIPFTPDGTVRAGLDPSAVAEIARLERELAEARRLMREAADWLAPLAICDCKGSNAFAQWEKRLRAFAGPAPTSGEGA